MEGKDVKGQKGKERGKGREGKERQGAEEETVEKGELDLNICPEPPSSERDPIA